MAKLKCAAHGRRVIVLEDKVLHRTGDGSACAFPVTYRGFRFSGIGTRGWVRYFGKEK